MSAKESRHPFWKAFVLLVLAAMAWMVAGTLRFGAPQETRTDDYYIANTQRDTGANNAVTAIVFDYRGFDTLGEATVLVCAVMGVGLALRRRQPGEECDE